MDKEEGGTSFAMVRRVRRLLGGVRAGHAGSLDPFATGLLPVATGRATRLIRFVAAGAKRYRARVRFGQATDTDDCTGQPVGGVRRRPEAAEIREALAGFLGVIAQRPPAYSAKHVGGRRAYRLARAGEKPALPPVPVRVDELELLDYDGEVAEIACQVGPGAYVRALARDLGERTGGAAHLVALRRTAVGPFRVSEAVRLGDLSDPAEARRRLLEPLEALRGMPRLPVAGDDLLFLTHGRTLSFRDGEALADAASGAAVAEPEIRCAVTPDASGEVERVRLVAIVSATAAGWRPILVWSGDPPGPA